MNISLKLCIRWDGSRWYLQDIPSKCRRIHLLLKCNGTFSKIDHILGHKSNLIKFKKIEIISSIFSDHNAMRLDINYKKKRTVRNTNTWRLNNLIINNWLVTEEIEREIKKFLKTHDNENTTIQNLWDKREGYSNTILPQETRKTLNRQPNFTPKTTEKRTTTTKKKNQN